MMALASSSSSSSSSVFTVVLTRASLRLLWFWGDTLDVAVSPSLIALPRAFGLGDVVCVDVRVL